ncbi:MAG: hypothetical protein IT326_00870 [Anaerolineae bacterium]|nr:hypothetical protein [Anaerolineae bacterium]
MAGEKKGAKKTVGKARKGDVVRHVMKLRYVQKDSGVFAPKYERADTPQPAAEEPTN